MHIDHIVIFVNDLKQSEEFYSSFLGNPEHRSDEDIAYRLGSTLLFLAEKENSNSDFDKKSIGLNHLALRVGGLDELKQYERKLNEASIKHSGIQIDKYGGKEFIWFDDPDGMRLEFYLRD